MGYTIPTDICIICNKPMSEYSQHLARLKKWACTICSSCEEDTIEQYGRTGLDKLISDNGLIVQIKNKLDSVSDHDEIKKSIHSMVEKFLEEEGEDGRTILDGIFDTLS